jgi:hypothetical protein
MLINFEGSAISCFDGIATKHGLLRAPSVPAVIRWANERVYLKVAYDWKGSFGVGVSIGEVPPFEYIEAPSYDLYELLQLRSSPDAEFVGHLQVIEAGAMHRSLCRLADLVEFYAPGLLDGDAAEFVELERYRKQRSAAYALERDLLFARKSADKAWRTGDYEEVIRSYAPIVNYLSKAERKRLKIAQDRAVEDNKGVGDNNVER